MHATIQKPIDEILGYLKPIELVFVVGCGNCAAKCHSGGEVDIHFFHPGYLASSISNLALKPFLGRWC